MGVRKEQIGLIWNYLLPIVKKWLYPKCYSHFGKHNGVSSKNKNRTTMWSRNSTSGYIYIKKKNKTNNQSMSLKRYMDPKVHSSIIYNCKDMEET